MQLGFVSAVFPDLSLEEVLAFAADEGFACVELMCWPRGAADRRYAGVTHLDVANFTPEAADHLRDLVRIHGVQISGLGYYPNPLDPDPTHRAAVVEHLKKVIRAAPLAGVGVVNTFIGRDPCRSTADTLATVREVWPGIVAEARLAGVRIGIEHCPMLFGDDEWPGGKNVAVSPAVWRDLFALFPCGTLGLNFDPSHLVWQFIDYLRPIEEFRERIFHVHAKDMEINHEMLYQDGVLGSGFRWAIPRLPGLGEVRWDRVIAALYAAGYDFVISIEHEDRKFEGSEELVKRGFALSRDVLSPYVV